MNSIQNAWSDLNEDSAQFLLDQAEKNIAATIETAKSLTDRAVNIMQFSVPLSLALIGLITTAPGKELFFLYLIGLGFALHVSYRGLQLYDLYMIQALGYRPSNLLKQEVLKMDKTYQRLGFVFSVLQDAENVIEINETSNAKRQRIMYSIMSSIKLGVVVICLYPVFLFLFEAWPW